MHHIVSDGWSLGLLAREIGLLYEPYVRGRLSAPRAAIQHSDFALWQRRWLQAGALALHRAYWRPPGGCAASPLPLPTDRLPPGRQASPGRGQLSRCRRALGRAQHRRAPGGRHTVHDDAGGVQGTPARYTGETDIVLGTPS